MYNSLTTDPLFADIDKILAAIDKMLVQTEDKGREERIIRSGYVPKAYCKDYSH